MAEDSRPRTPSAPSAAEQVAAILGAAESTAETLRLHTEERMRARIAEGERAAQYRVDAAEAEAQELVEDARRTVERLLREGRERDETAKLLAASAALEIEDGARNAARITAEQASAAAASTRAAAERDSRVRLEEARAAADAVQAEGLELIANLRAMGDSLHANAERLLRDVQSLHSQMISRIEVVPAGRGGPRTPPAPRPADPGSLDVPEFIPPR